MVRCFAVPLSNATLTAPRSDNDMYHHMNNSVYYYLHVSHESLVLIEFFSTDILQALILLSTHT